MVIFKGREEVGVRCDSGYHSRACRAHLQIHPQHRPFPHLSTPLLDRIIVIYKRHAENVQLALEVPAAAVLGHSMAHLWVSSSRTECLSIGKSKRSEIEPRCTWRLQHGSHVLGPRSITLLQTKNNTSRTQNAYKDHQGWVSSESVT